MLESDNLNFWSGFGCSKTAIFALALSSPARSCSTASLLVLGRETSAGIDFLTVLILCFKSVSIFPSICSIFRSIWTKLSFVVADFSCSSKNLSKRSLTFPDRTSNSSLVIQLPFGVDAARWVGPLFSGSSPSRSGTKYVLAYIY